MKTKNWMLWGLLGWQGMATAMVTIGPIILLYPFLQKYYIKGLTMGAVKG